MPVTSISTALAEPKAASCKLQWISRETRQLRDISQPLAQQGGYWYVPVKDSRECVLCFWQLEDLCNALLILPSCHTFQFPEHPKTCPVCKWKPSILPEAEVPGHYPPERKLPLRTAVGAKFDYSVARTKVWGPAKDLDPQRRSLCMPRQATSNTFQHTPSHRTRSH